MQIRLTAEQSEIVGKRCPLAIGKILAHSSTKEQNQHNGRRDPEGPVQVRVTLQDIQEVGAGEERGPASRQNSRGVDIEELCVKGDGPQEPLRGPG